MYFCTKVTVGNIHVGNPKPAMQPHGEIVFDVTPPDTRHPTQTLVMSLAALRMVRFQRMNTPELLCHV
jgi:hypothetical protein